MSSEGKNEGIIQNGGTINAEQLAVGRNATVSGTVIKTINQLQNSETSEAVELAALLKQLQESINVDPNLKVEEKNEALEQVEEIAVAGTDIKSGKMQKLAKAASRTLKGMMTELPNATNFVEACSKLLPLISKIFGF
jgi:hypothetical protein